MEQYLGLTSVIRFDNCNMLSKPRVYKAHARFRSDRPRTRHENREIETNDSSLDLLYTMDIPRRITCIAHRDWHNGKGRHPPGICL